MKKLRLSIPVFSLSLWIWAVAAFPQEANNVTPTASVSDAPLSVTQVPRLVRYSGTLLEESGKARTGVAGVTFLFYKDQSGGAPLWMETQNVVLDAKGHYSVLLGSTKPDGLPTELFAGGEARWLAVQPEREAEQPRVLLLSVPYALKAMDAETLGGRPISDFVLSSSQSGKSAITSTAAPQAGATSGNALSQTPGLGPITGGGTKNFIPIWTSSTALGKSTMFETAGKVGIGTTVPAFTLDVHGNTNVAGSLFGQFLELTANVTNPLLAISQGGTGGGISVRTANGGDGIFVGSQGSNAIGVAADTPNGAVALLGTNENDAKFANAIQGQANGGTQETIGVRGSSQSPIGIGTLGNQGQSSIFVAFEGSVGAGVWGDTNATGGSHVGVVGTSDDAIGVGAHTQGTDAAALYAQNDTTTTTSLLFDAIGGSVGGECFMDVSGNLHCTGNITPVVAVKQGTRKAALYAVASPENWFEDFGSGHLSNGAATISLDPDFAETVNTSVDYHVFLTPSGECKGLYVSQKGPASFEVRETGGGSSSISFDYRIVAHRRGQESVRMADLTEQMQSHPHMPVMNKKP